MKAPEEFNNKNDLQKKMKSEDQYFLPLPLENEQEEVFTEASRDSKTSETGRNLEGNSRCVSVDTILIAPDGRNEKRERFKGKSEIIKFRCSIYEKKLLKIKAKHSGISLSEFCRRAIYDKEIKERLSDDHIEIYKTLLKFHNNFKSIGNMFRRKDPKLAKEVYALSSTIKSTLNDLKR